MLADEALGHIGKEGRVLCIEPEDDRMTMIEGLGRNIGQVGAMDLHPLAPALEENSRRGDDTAPVKDQFGRPGGKRGATDES